MASLTRIVVAFCTVVAVVSCAGPASEEPPVGVENPELGIRLSSIPEGLTLTRNEGLALELRPARENPTGIIWFTVSPEVHAVNLVEAVNDHRAQIESLPDGNYLGAQELTGDIGSAFYSRGRFSEVDQSLEETVIVTLHRTGNQLLTMHYRYPAADDSAARVEQLIGILAEIEW